MSKALVPSAPIDLMSKSELGNRAEAIQRQFDLSAGGR